MIKVVSAMLLVKKHLNGILLTFKALSLILSSNRWNASTFWCQKGCDFARGRNVDPILRYNTQTSNFIQERS
jgi:hypothetical protein